MKRAALLYCADIDAPRFKVLNARDQLPFIVSRNETEGRGTKFTLDHAFRLRLMLDLLGDAEMAGLGPAYVNSIIGNAMRFFPRHPLNQIEPKDWWLGVVVFEEALRDGETHRYSEWMACEIDNFHKWIAQRTEPKEDGTRLKPVRVFMVNATRVANFVRDRAEEMGLPEGSDFLLIAV